MAPKHLSDWSTGTYNAGRSWIRRRLAPLLGFTLEISQSVPFPETLKLQN